MPINLDSDPCWIRDDGTSVRSGVGPDAKALELRPSGGRPVMVGIIPGFPIGTAIRMRSNPELTGWVVNHRGDGLMRCSFGHELVWCHPDDVEAGRFESIFVPEGEFVVVTDKQSPRD